MWGKAKRALILVGLCVVLIVGLLWSTRAWLLGLHLSRVLGTTVSVNGVKIAWHKVKLYGVSIESPPGSSLRESFFAESITVPLSPFRLILGPIKPRQLMIRHSILGLERLDPAGSLTNWHLLLERMGERRGPLFFFERAVFDHLSIACVGYGAERRILSVPYHRLELCATTREIFPLSQALELVFRAMLQEASGQLVNKPFEGETAYVVSLRFLEPLGTTCNCGAASLK